MTAPLMSGIVWGALLALVLAVHEIAPLRRACAAVAVLVLGALVRAGLID